MHKNLIHLMAFAALAILLAATAQATTIELVTVGNPGNTGEYSGSGNYIRANTGAVAYSYQIGKYEVTAGQYAEFLSAKAASDPYLLYNTSMATVGTTTGGCGIVRNGSDGSYTYSVLAGYSDRPVNYVSFWDTCRFTNWLHNGQGNGSTETGAYTLNGENGATTGGGIFHNADAKWWVPTEDEWYKAAYYDPTKDGVGGYWDQATRTDYGDTPGRDLTEATKTGNNANYGPFPTGGLDNPYYLTRVGEFEQSDSFYGTFDQMGNVYETVESLAGYPTTSVKREYRGGAYNTNLTTTSYLIANNRNSGNAPNYDTYAVGFRVAAAVPEPGTLVLLAAGLLGLLAYVWRKQK